MSVTTYNAAQIKAQLEELRGRLLAIAGEDLADDQQLLHDLIDGQTDALDQLRAIVRSALTDEAMADGLSLRIKRMQERRSRLERRAEICRNVVKEAMGVLGLAKLLADDFTASLGQGKPKVEVTDVNALPKEFQRVKVEANKELIAQELKRGTAVPGATLSTQNEPVLRIQTA